MDNFSILNHQILKRVALIFGVVLVLLIGLPFIIFNLLGVDVTAINPYSKIVKLGLLDSEEYLKSYLIQTIIQWTTFLFAVSTIFLAFIQYRFTKDRVALLIGSVVLYSSIFMAVNFVAVHFHSISERETIIDSIIWSGSKEGGGILFLVGSFILFRVKQQTAGQVNLFIGFGMALFLLATVWLYSEEMLLSSSIEWFTNDLIVIPYRLFNTVIYFLVIFIVYPDTYKKHPGILTRAIFYMSITQILISLYPLLFSPMPYHGIYNVVFFLKLMVYFIPFLCLVINYCSSYQSILEAQKKLHTDQEKLKFIAAHDPLTNLYTRREFEHLLNRTVADHFKNQDKFAMFLIDVDNFKTINDSLGHVYGDSFLLKFSEQLSYLTRKDDILSRIGGDEFTIILPSIKSPTMARILADRIIHNLNIPYDVGEKLLTGSASLGIAIYPDDGETSEELLKNADIAMYNAKKMGKNTYQCFSDKLNEECHRESEVESYLRDALKNNELTLYFQPQYNLLTKEIVGAEVLLRWNNKTLGQVSPMEFIPIAEHSNLIINIGGWVLQKACEQAQKWSKQYKRDLHFSINVSPVQFENRTFVSHLKTTLDVLNYSASNIGIEITETLLMKNDEMVLLGLNELSCLGARILLDDFGVGYSSLLRLQSLPINTLKIDKFFISAIQGGVKKVVIVDTIITLADELGMTVIAEGIETEEQLNYLISRKCYEGQGFYLAKPMPAEEFEKLAYLT
jgi:diguanylate cyclase (GGDEF)-like protein